jgi:hypothetical protein
VDDITSSLKAQTHFLNNLLSIRGRDTYIFGAGDFIFKTHYINGVFSSIDAFNAGEWAKIRLQQNRYGDLNDHVVSIRELPFDLDRVNQIVQKVQGQLLQAKKEDKVWQVPYSTLERLAYFIPYEGWFFLNRIANQLPAHPVPYIYQFKFPPLLNPVREGELVAKGLKAILGLKTCNTFSLDEYDFKALSALQEIKNSLKIKGIHFAENKAYLFENKNENKRLYFVCTADEDRFLVTENLTDQTWKIERFPKGHTTFIWHHILKNEAFLKPINPDFLLDWLRPQFWRELYAENRLVSLLFGKQYDSYFLSEEGEVWHSYGNIPEDFDALSEFIVPCNYFLQLAFKAH